jgi:hypothetical protein
MKYTARAMDDMLSNRLQQLNDEISAAVNEVDAALEGEDEARELAAGQMVASLAQRWRDLLAEMTPADREVAERSVGRRMTDLRRSAAGLSRRDSGSSVKRADDAGFVPFLERRAPPKSIVPQRAAPSNKLSVGGEVDSWCGKCKEMTTHNVVAMVGDHAKQVICQVCNSRHDYRTEPPARHRTAVRAATGGEATTAHQRMEDRELQKRQEAKRALQKELADAVEPRPFDPKARYKAGEIIVHPEHGRGKIENVLRGSMLVRFLEGLRPLDLS